MTVVFTPEEVNRIPSDLRPLMQDYALVFDNLLDAIGNPPLSGDIETMDIYFDNEVLPALSFMDGRVIANPATDDPKVFTIFINDECGYMQVQNRVLLNRVGNDFLKVFEVA